MLESFTLIAFGITINHRSRIWDGVEFVFGVPYLHLSAIPSFFRAEVLLQSAINRTELFRGLLNNKLSSLMDA